MKNLPEDFEKKAAPGEERYLMLARLRSKPISAEDTESVNQLIDAVWKLEYDFIFLKDLGDDPQAMTVENFTRGIGGLLDMEQRPYTNEKIKKLLSLSKVVELLHRRAMERQKNPQNNSDTGKHIKIVEVKTIDDAMSLMTGGGRNRGHIEVSNKIVEKVRDLAAWSYDPYSDTAMRLLKGQGGSYDIKDEYSEQALKDLHDINELLDIIHSEAYERRQKRKEMH